MSIQVDTGSLYRTENQDALVASKRLLTATSFALDSAAWRRSRRLREAADGTRPLRTLALDPAWQRQVRTTLAAGREPELDAEQRQILADRVDDLRRHAPAMPTDPAEIAEIARQALGRAEKARQIAREDELAGWDYVPDEAGHGRGTTA